MQLKVQVAAYVSELHTYAFLRYIADVYELLKYVSEFETSSSTLSAYQIYEGELLKCLVIINSDSWTSLLVFSSHPSVPEKKAELTGGFVGALVNDLSSI